MLTGTLANAAAVVVGTTLGLTVLRGLPKRWHDSAFQAVGTAVILLGVATALPSLTDWAVVVILSLVAGSLVGEALDLEGRIDLLEERAERRFGAGGRGAARAAVTAALIFCVGPMTILGAIQDGLGGSHDLLFAKSALDGLTSIALAATLGAGVYLAAGVVLFYQGGLAVAAHFLGHGLSQGAVLAMSGAGGAVILAIGLNMVGATRLRTAAMLPAVVLAPVGAWLVAIAGRS